MRLLYSIAIGFYAFAVRIASLFNNKAKLLAIGWKEWQRHFHNSKVNIQNSKIAWFHASSLGEFEQARPVIEAFRISHPEYKICLTFFSPSGYEIRKNYSLADIVCYLPPDTRRNARELMQLMHPDIAFFVKYDFWFNCLNALNVRKTPTYIFSSIFRPNQYFFRWYGRWFAKQLHCFKHIFVQNDESAMLLKSIGINDVSIAGDTRYDRVADIAKSAKPIEPIELFLNQSVESSGLLHHTSNIEHQTSDIKHPKVLVAGSSWEPDEHNIKAFLDHYDKTIRLILAPHVIDESHLIAIERLFGKNNCIRFSSIINSQSEKPNLPNILIIDNIGMLSAIYQYATVAYIGGGFGKGIHNILEATAYNIPVCFGPNYHKFKEARDMIAAGAARSYNNADELTSILSEWLDDADSYSKASIRCKEAMSKEGGSTQKILGTISIA